MNAPKRHHYIPKMILRNFCDADGKMYFHRKGNTSGKVEYCSIENLFVEKHLYTIFEESGEKDAKIEEEISKLESDVSLVIVKILKAANKNTTPGLSLCEKEMWDRYSYLQWQRVPESPGKKEFEDNKEEFFREKVKEFERNHRPLSKSEKRKFSSSDFQNRLIHNASANILSKKDKNVLDILNNKGLGVIKIGLRNKKFILGSRPIIKLSYPGRSHISDPTVEIWFPISPTVAVTPWSQTGNEELVTVNDAKNIRYLNEGIAMQSLTIASGSKALIESLVNPR